VVYVTDTQAKELNDLVEKRQSLLDDIEKKKKEADEISNRIKQMVGENAGLATDRFKVTWRPMTRSVADIEKLKADGLAEKYLKTVDFRMLKVVNYNK
jgi:predicted phage-related endonuclease